ncbi:hypothetical protein GCM10010435_79320 [Winogradskya consettensis]|uniref:Uncharacterized protein n=1 Tax=Winogradskya consettensis TaxID=113560 RepID=A0A919SS31_9ACTN|nr:hypothetical protein [Actinoplanes consettensis]GIM77497.1 hypothetical protein Aco04nite_55640 [Actinoplanes consettensis]
MVTGEYRDFFVAMAGAAGALTGLLFVALSLTPHNSPKLDNPVIRQVRASAALIAFTNTLVVSLFGLVPETNLGYPAASMGVVGVLFTAAGIRTVLASVAATRARLRQAGLIVLLLSIFGAELICGGLVIAGINPEVAMHLIGYALCTSILVGVARAWEMVSDRDTGVVASLATLVEHKP